ncbi:MAG: hypothetical protein RLZ98_636 [Pseudomonadota bacterium]|jgi:glucose/arabinose dehydrogenase
MWRLHLDTAAFHANIPTAECNLRAWMEAAMTHDMMTSDALRLRGFRAALATLLPALMLVAGTMSATAQQTRAPAPAERSQFKTTKIAEGLEHPWAVQELTDGRLIVTERPGRIRIVDAEGRLSSPVANVPKVAADGQGGLLDLVLAPDFATSRTLYFTYSEPRGSGRSGTALAKAVLDADGKKPALSNVRVIFRQKPDTRSALHFGSRIALAGDGTLYVTLGDRYGGRDKAQSGDNHYGKVVHLKNDGTPAAAAPHKDGWLPEIWSIGHRNPQAAAINPATGRLWTVEHGARGGDEINNPAAGKNYGWPVITYGRDYSGEKIGVGTSKEGLEQPVYYWDPSIAPSGMTFYTSDRYPAWKGNLFVGALAGTHLSRLVLDGDKVVAEERLLDQLDERIRDVRQARDGSLLVVTDDGNGSILRIVPAP